VELLEWNDWYGTCQKMWKQFVKAYRNDLGKYTLDILNNVYVYSNIYIYTVYVFILLYI
jgi:hypothetical protein